MGASAFDAIVIGSGPNGLAAAITLARAGRSVLLREAADVVGGGTRSAELTLPGFVHDVCSTVHAMAGVSPFLRSLPLREHGLELVEPPLAFAQPMEDGTAAVVHRSLDATAEGLGGDGPAYRRLIVPFLDDAPQLFDDLLGPRRLPRRPLRLARFGVRGIRSARSLACSVFQTEAARALFAGVCAHAMVPLTWRGTAALGLVLTIAAHATGWPVARGGSQKLANALASYFRSLGGTIETGNPVEKLDALPFARAVLCDLTPRQLVQIGGDQLPAGYRRRLARYRYGPGVFKIDWALDGPTPWKSAPCARAGTLHLGGTLDEMCAAEAAPWNGEHAERPYVLFVQPSLFDPTRAPPGRQTAWAYCHVPNGSTLDMTERIEAQIERFAPGFRDRILARHTMNTADMERHNANLVGGDIAGGASNLAQLLARPVMSLNPYVTPVPGLYLCSASTPPGGGVHGMCGYHAAKAALRDRFS